MKSITNREKQSIKFMKNWLENQSKLLFQIC